MSASRLSAFLVLAVLGWAACAPSAVVTVAEPPPPTAEAPAVDGVDAAVLAEDVGLDPAIRSGTLANGLTYYVRRNSEPRERAELRLVVNAGSVVEDEDQRGIGHLVEHMAFNGTELFPEIELQRFLQRIGMRFGPDVNAYISFDETVYMLQVPTDEPELLDTGLTVLREWAGNVTLYDADIDAERGVVLEEWRAGLGAWSRVRDQQFPVLFQGSRYAERLPIGLPEVIQHAPADRIRDFYRDWYRPELMAVVAVGDFDPDAIEAVIQERFADLVNPSGAPERPEFEVPIADATRIAIATDPELTVATLQLMRKLPTQERKSVGDFREQVIDQLYLRMMNARLRELTRQPGAPFVGAFATTGGFVRPISPVGMMAQVHDGRIPDALETLLVETERVRRHGFEESELDRARAGVLREAERAYAQREQQPSGQLASQLVSHYLQEVLVPSVERRYELLEMLLPGITLTEVQARAEVVTDESGRVILVAAPESERAAIPGEEELRAVLRAVERMDIEPYVDHAPVDALMARVPHPGTIVSESAYADDEITEWTLSNGLTVVVRPTDFRSDEVLFIGVRPGGTSVISDDRYRAATQATSAVAAGGVGTFSASDLERMLAGRTVQVSPFLQTEREGIWGSFSPGDMETALQLVHLHFTEPRRDGAAFEAYLEGLRTFIANRDASPFTAFGDTLAAVLSQYHPRSRPLTAQDVERIELDEVLDVYRERFREASGFTFVFVGAVDPDSLAPLVQQYIASLPVNRFAQHEPRDLGIRPPPGIVERTVFRGMEPRAQVALVFSGDLKHNHSVPDNDELAADSGDREAARWERFVLHRLSEALEIRLREELREERGGVYGVGVNMSTNRLTGTYTLSVNFGTDPERVDELVQTVFEEVERFRTTGPDDDITGRTIEAHRRQSELALRSNQHWRGALWTAYYYDEPPQNYLSSDDLRSRLASGHLRDAAREYISPERYVRVVLLPEHTAD